MALVTITRKPSTLQGYQLTSPADMTTALDYLKTRGYSGSVTQSKSGATTIWTMTLQSDTGSNGQSGLIGDWVVIENDQIASIVPAAKAAAMYQVS